MLVVVDAWAFERQVLMADKPIPSFADTIANLRNARHPLAALRGIVVNNWIKLRRLDNCCGNYGDPGC